MFWKRGRNYDEAASRLLAQAKTVATVSYMSLAETYPAFERIVGSQLQDYDFCVTVAGVCCSFYSLRGRDSREVAQIAEAIGRQMEAWDQKSRCASDDLSDFVRRYGSGGGKVPVAAKLGLWIYLSLRGNLTGMAEDDIQAMHGLGQLLLHSFADWWTEE